MNESNNKIELTDETLSTLLEQAGPRAAPTRAMTDSAFAAAEQVWMAKLAQRRRRARSRYLRWTGAIAASLVVCIAGYLAFAPIDPAATTIPFASVKTVDSGVARSSWSVGDRVPVGAQIRTTSGETLTLSLDRGITAYVDESTTLVVTDTDAMTLGTGRLIVDTGRRADTTLQISTPAGLVQNIGTQFDVQVDAAQTLVAVREGAVTIAGPAEVWHAPAGQEWQILADGSASQRTVSPFAARWSAIDNEEPDGLMLTALLDWVKLESGHELRFESPEVERRAATIIIRGRLPDGEPMEVLADALMATDLRYQLDPDGTITIGSAAR